MVGVPPRAEKVERGAYIPFGAGPRVCLGKHLGLMEAVLLLAMIIKDWQPRLRVGHPVEPLGRMTLRPRLGLPTRILPRPPAELAAPRGDAAITQQG